MISNDEARIKKSVNRHRRRIRKIKEEVEDYAKQKKLYKTVASISGKIKKKNRIEPIKK